MLLFEQNEPKVIETGNMRPIHIGLWTLSPVPVPYIKEFYSTVLQSIENISQKFVRHKTCAIVLRNIMKATAYVL
jgi:hypothetical protein